MIVGRVVYRGLIPMAFVVPVWVLIGRGVLLDGIGWDFFAYLLLCPILFVALLAISALMMLRPGARAEKSVTAWGAVVMIALWATLLATGFVAHPALVAVAIVLLLGTFWFAVWELVAEGRRRFRAVMDDIDATARGARASVPQPETLDIGEVIVVTSEDVTNPRIEGDRS